MNDSIEALQSRLDSISEDLADLALNLLRESAEAGQTKPPAQEKTITRARRAVEKASALLGSVVSDETEW